MLTKNLERKKEGILDSNNDIQFKMGENMVPVIQESSCFVGIQSPGALGVAATMDLN